MKKTIQALFLTALIAGTQCNANPLSRILASRFLAKGNPDYVVRTLNFISLAIITHTLYKVRKANKISEEAMKNSQEAMRKINHLKKT